MNPIPDHSKLRWPLDVRIERIDQESVIYINCPLGIASTPLLLIPEVGPVLSALASGATLQQLLQKFSPMGFREDTLIELIKLLDEHLFLDSPRYHEAAERVRLEFSNAEVRQSSLAGLGFARDRDALVQEIDGYLARAGSPPPARIDEAIVCLSAPHIDYRRGSAAYGITYNRLRGEAHDTYILIGTSHQYSSYLFHLTAKDFATPLGPLPCDREFVADLASKYGAARSFADEFLHRREHSLELQLPFLRRITSGGSIVPILIGGFHKMVDSGRLPSEFDEYENMVASLVSCLRERLEDGKRICFIAGVDMAHVGKHFGDKDALSPAFMEHIGARDRVYLDCLERQDKKALFEHIAEDRDARKVCGFPTIYTILDCFDRLGWKCRVETFDYRQAVDYSTDCAVTFAGVGFYKSFASASA